MTTLAINADVCRFDGMCADVCPFGLIVKNEKAVPTFIEKAEDMCFECGHCIAVCASNALSLNGETPDKLVPVKKELKISFEQAEQHLKNNRSIRVYKDKAASKEVIEKLIDITRWAPTGMNAQPLMWRVIQDKEEVKKIAGLTVDAMRGSDGPLKGMVDAWDNGKDMVLRDAPHLLLAFVPEGSMAADAVISLTCFELAANAEGLGTCWAGIVMMFAGQHEPLKEALKIPEGYALQGAMMFGYPKYRYSHIPRRKEAKIIWE